MKITSLYILCSCFGCLLLLPGCDLQKEIEVPLPQYEDKLVVECYLEAGKPFKMTVTESSSYFAKPSLPDVKDAKVDIIYKGQNERLTYKLIIDPQNSKAYNYISERNVPSLADEVFSLQVEDTKGRKITGETTFLPAVSIKEVEWKYNKDSLAFLLIRFNDDPAASNYYRIQIHRDSLNKKRMWISAWMILLQLIMRLRLVPAIIIERKTRYMLHFIIWKESFMISCKV